MATLSIKSEFTLSVTDQQVSGDVCTLTLNDVSNVAIDDIFYFNTVDNYGHVFDVNYDTNVVTLITTTAPDTITSLLFYHYYYLTIRNAGEILEQTLSTPGRNLNNVQVNLPLVPRVRVAYSWQPTVALCNLYEVRGILNMIHDLAGKPITVELLDAEFFTQTLQNAAIRLEGFNFIESRDEFIVTLPFVADSVGGVV